MRSAGPWPEFPKRTWEHVSAAPGRHWTQRHSQSVSLARDVRSPTRPFPPTCRVWPLHAHVVSPANPRVRVVPAQLSFGVLLTVTCGRLIVRSSQCLQVRSQRLPNNPVYMKCGRKEVPREKTRQRKRCHHKTPTRWTWTTGLPPRAARMQRWSVSQPLSDHLATIMSFSVSLASSSPQIRDSGAVAEAGPSKRKPCSTNGGTVRREPMSPLCLLYVSYNPSPSCCGVRRAQDQAPSDSRI